jgi:hypothetical protein
MDNRTQGGDYAKMLWSVAEQLKEPLSVISRRAELVCLTGDYSFDDANGMRIQADIGLALIDSYLLGLDLWQSQSELPLEAVSVSSIMADTTQSLYRYARQMDVTLDMSIEGRFGPVMSNARGLKAAMLSLGCAMVDAAQGSEDRRLTFAVHRSRQGIAAGMYGLSGQLNSTQWGSSQSLQGKSGQPLPALHGSSAGLFVANSILQAMGSQLGVGRRSRQNGLRAEFLPSQQLSLI